MVLPTRAAAAATPQTQGRELLLYFSDFKQAFTSVSHKAIDKALAAAGASAKVRALVRGVYDMAEAQVRMQDGLGQEAMSDPFCTRNFHS